MTTPDKLGKYPITGVLGKGAMGVVYKGHDPVINRTVAIKTIHKQMIGQDLSGSTTTTRFRNEARAVGRVSHPGIVAIYEYGEDGDVAYIAMEYVEGRTLSQVLGATPRPPEADILKLMDQLLAALDCAHQHGVWHRDIKPANLIVTHNGQLKLTDFGIARIESVVLTQVTSTIGTPGYMAPEQYVGENIDHRVDLFACGALLYGMLVGHPPFTGTMETIMYKVVNEQPTPPSKVADAQRPEFYDAIVAKALAKKPQDRYASAAEFRAALARRVLPAAQENSETTVIIVPPGTSAPVAVAGVVEPPSGGPSSGGANPLPGWDAATLQRVELALAAFVGPMARVMVRQAAKRSADLNGLKAAVSAHLQNESDRKRFLAALNTPGTSTKTDATGPAGAGVALSAETLAQAVKVMTKHIGPIASVVVKKAAAKAATREQFFQLLAEQTDDNERERLLNELRRK